MARVVCCCCAKQIVQDKANPNDAYITNGPCVSMGPTLGWCCVHCSKDLDEDGLFPEERSSF